MRALFWTIFSVLVFGVVAYAQPAGDRSPIIPTPGTGGAAPGKLTLNPNIPIDARLIKWEEAFRGVGSIVVKPLYRTDKLKKGETHWEGEARYLKPNLAALRLIQKEDPKIYELVISTGNFVYEYRPEFKRLVVHEVDPRNGNFDNNLLSFLFGMTAAEAKARYELTLSKENADYIYIDILPRHEADKREFTRAQIVFFAATTLPRRLWFEKPNGDQVTWDLPEMDTKVRLAPTDFRPPQAPPGWETIKEPLNPAPPGDGKPRIIRPTSGK